MLAKSLSTGASTVEVTPVKDNQGNLIASSTGYIKPVLLYAITISNNDASNMHQLKITDLDTSNSFFIACTHNSSLTISLPDPIVYPKGFSFVMTDGTNPANGSLATVFYR